MSELKARPSNSAGLKAASLKKDSSSSQAPHAVLNSSAQALHAALNSSLSKGTFIDTKFYCFSRRGSSGVVDKPMAVYANGIALKQVSPYFETLLSGSFIENAFADLSTKFPSDRPPFSKDYDYEDDSDLDDEEPSRNDAMSRQGDTSTMSGIVEKAGESETSQPGKAEISIGDPSAMSEIIGRGRIIHIEDMAFKTWQAFVFYAYTGEVVFAPLRSTGSTEVEWRRESFRPLRCSPKSMYRLAEKSNLVHLKKAALDNIRSQLTWQNVWAELFSIFTSRHDEIQQLQVKYLKQFASASLKEIPRWAMIIAGGELPHSGAVLALLLQSLMTSSADE